jgi:glycosyltransferase involved in cell wall biosynthesis
MLMRIILCATNDIATDRRIHRTVLSLQKIPCTVSVIGRAFGKSMELPEFPYPVSRIRMLFKKGLLFYAEFNLRLFFMLLFRKTDLLVANDLDTLPAVFLVSRLRGLIMVYDSHEYFTEVPELVARAGVKKFWEGLEALLVPRLKFASTVSDSIAAEYQRKYGINMQVIRNLPFKLVVKPQPSPSIRKSDEKIILYQGSLNIGRGLEAAISAMSFVDHARLIIIGSGDVEHQLRALVHSLALEEKVGFMGRISPQDLPQYTVQADLGISLEEKLGLNYYYALPNKLFDYIQARVPVLVSDLPEMAGIVTRYSIGKVTPVQDPYRLALTMTEMLTDESSRKVWRKNLETAANELCWENEESRLMALYGQAIAYRRQKTG